MSTTILASSSCHLIGRLDSRQNRKTSARISPASCSDIFYRRFLPPWIIRLAPMRQKPSMCRGCPPSAVTIVSLNTAQLPGSDRRYYWGDPIPVVYASSKSGPVRPNGNCNGVLIFPLYLQASRYLKNSSASHNSTSSTRWIASCCC